MTGTLPAEVQAVFERFMTTEYTTVDARGQPIVWPVTPYYRPGDPTIDITTGVGYPKKALNARRNPRVALLFSDPTGSGIEAGIRVLVQGTAEVDDEDLRANRDRYRTESDRKVPRVRKEWFPPAPFDRLFGWYFERIYVRVRPERVFVWPEGDPLREPEVHGAHMEEVRSGHSEEQPRAKPGASGGAIAWDERIGEIGGLYNEAVLSWVAPDGFPLSARLPVSLDGDAKMVRLGSEPAGLPLLEGRASLTAHSHAPDYEWVRNFQVRGDLIRDERGWALVPHRLLGGMEMLDEGIVKRYRRNFRRAVSLYLNRRRVLRERKARS